MKKLRIYCAGVLLLSGCAQQQYRPSPEARAEGDSVRICAEQYPAPHTTNKQRRRFNKCKADQYARLLPIYVQEEGQYQQAAAARYQAAMTYYRPQPIQLQPYVMQTPTQTHCHQMGSNIDCQSY